MQEQVIETSTPVSNDFKEWTQPQLNGNQAIITTISTSTSSKQGGSSAQTQQLKQSTQDSQKENNEKFEYEWDDEEDG